MGVGDPLDEVKFVARSRHRVRVLETLASAPCTRSDLRETNDIPQPTLSRVLRDFEDRGWVRREEHEYRLTPLGQLLVEEFASLLATVEIIGKLRNVIDWLPCGEFDFGLDRFAGAEITRANPSNVIAPATRIMELMREAHHVRLLAHAIAPEFVRVNWRATVHGEQTFEAVFTTDAIEAARSVPESATQLREIVESGRGTVFRYDGIVPCGLMILDDTIAGIGLRDESGAIRALVETRDGVIREWVERRIDRHRREADSIEPHDLIT